MPRNPAGIYVADPGPEDSGRVIYHRIETDESTPGTPDLITVAEVSSITLNVYQKSDNSLVAGPTSLTVADVILDTPVTINSVGFNFKYKTLASHLPTGGQTFIFEILVVPASGEQFYLTPVHVPAVSMLSS